MRQTIASWTTDHPLPYQAAHLATVDAADQASADATSITASLATTNLAGAVDTDPGMASPAIWSSDALQVAAPMSDGDAELPPLA